MFIVLTRARRSRALFEWVVWETFNMAAHGVNDRFSSQSSSLGSNRNTKNSSIAMLSRHRLTVTDLEYRSDGLAFISAHNSMAANA